MSSRETNADLTHASGSQRANDTPASSPHSSPGHNRIALGNRRKAQVTNSVSKSSNMSSAARQQATAQQSGHPAEVLAQGNHEQAFFRDGERGTFAGGAHEFDDLQGVESRPSLTVYYPAAARRHRLGMSALAVLGTAALFFVGVVLVTRSVDLARARVAPAQVAPTEQVKASAAQNTASEPARQAQAQAQQVQAQQAQTQQAQALAGAQQAQAAIPGQAPLPAAQAQAEAATQHPAENQAQAAAAAADPQRVSPAPAALAAESSVNSTHAQRGQGPHQARREAGPPARAAKPKAPVAAAAAKTNAPAAAVATPAQAIGKRALPGAGLGEPHMAAPKKPPTASF